MKNRKVRVRFAPSPTGPLHIGGVRTALFNYLFAKKNNGDFILRIEDTDQTRFVEGAEDYIVEALEWCGLKFDESVKNGGNYGPYKQSERKEIYRQFADKLLESGNAYIAFDSPEELDKLRKDYEAQKLIFTYNAEIRNSLTNSLVLTENEVKRRMDSGDPYVIRYKMPENTTIVMNDIIRGEVKVNSSTLDDKVLFKSDGMPTYHLANVVDDYLMEISHVIRGEEWLPSLPLHVCLYDSLGWKDAMPEFAHLPLLLKPTGNGKLSKRDGDKMGFPVFPLFWPHGETARGYREDGYFPDAFVNLLALLGWNPGTEQEIFTLEQLVELFSLERVNKSGARFDPEKAKWFNHQYMQLKSNEEIACLFKKELEKKAVEISLEKLITIVGLVKERIGFVSELWEQSWFFFNSPETYDQKIVEKKWKEETPGILQGVVNLLQEINNFERDNLEIEFKAYLEKNEIGFGQVMNAFRLCLTGGATGPDLFSIVSVIGKEETVNRINLALEKIK
ncbi:MAG: glutamate--tRNA ligase [Bacteroidales bacterium]|nr:glutamate--tRNA ligase [Bacteroidales bacterium]